MIMCLCLSFVGAKAQDTHWQVDIYAYQYDMTVYFTLTEKGEPIVDLSDYEVSAFCGNECRGVATILMTEKDGIQKQCGYLRIRSNVQQGETISFQLYQKSSQREIVIEETCDFENNALNGTPSSPMLLTPKWILIGDVNSDGEVDVLDVLTLVNFIVGKTSSVSEEAADMNGDGDVDVLDVLTLVNRIIGKN